MRELNDSILSENERIALDYYCANNQKSDTIRLLQKLNGEVRQLTEEGVKKRATKFFALNRVINYIDSKQRELARIYQDKAIKASIDTSNSAETNLAEVSKEEVRNYVIDEMQKIINDPNSTPADRLSALAKITDIRNSKEKDEKEMSEFEKTVMFVLPADICEDCPHKEKIYKEHGYPATEEEIKEAFYKNNVKKD